MLPPSVWKTKRNRTVSTNQVSEINKDNKHDVVAAAMVSGKMAACL